MLRSSAFLSGRAEFYLSENVVVGLFFFSSSFFSFLPTLKTWEEKRSASDSQQSGLAPLAAGESSASRPRNTPELQGPVGTGWEADTA